MGYLTGGSSMGLTNSLIKAQQQAAIRRNARMQNQADSDPFSEQDPQAGQYAQQANAAQGGMLGGGMMSPGMQMSENLANPDQGMGLAKNAGLFLAQGLNPATSPKQQPNDFQNPDGSHDWSKISTALFADISRKHPDWSPKEQASHVMTALMQAGDPTALQQVGKIAKWGEHLSSDRQAKILTPEELARDYPDMKVPMGEQVQVGRDGKLEIFDKDNTWQVVTHAISPTMKQTFKVASRPAEDGSFPEVPLGTPEPIATTSTVRNENILPGPVEADRAEVQKDLTSFRGDVKAVNMALHHTDNIIGQLESAKGVGLGGVMGSGLHVLGEVNGVIGSVRAAAGQLDPENGQKGLQSALAGINTGDYDGFFQKYGILEARAKSNIVALAYEIAQINKKTNLTEGRLGKDDINNAMEQIGAKSSDPKIMAASLRETVGNMFHKLEGDLSFSSLHMRMTKNAKDGASLGGAEDYNQEAFAAYGDLRKQWPGYAPKSNIGGVNPPREATPAVTATQPPVGNEPTPASTNRARVVSPAELTEYARTHKVDEAAASKFLESQGYTIGNAK